MSSKSVEQKVKGQSKVDVNGESGSRDLKLSEDEKRKWHSRRPRTKIEDSVVIGGNSAVQQFTRIGRLAMIGGMTGVLKDVIPFGLSFGNRNFLQGINLIGLRRKKYENKKIIELDDAYKKIFSSNNLYENLSKINGEFKGNELVEEVTNFINRDKKRPICTPLLK